MLLHRRQDAEIALYAPGVVIADVALYHLDQFFLAGEALAVVTFSFQDAPEALHRAVVNAVCHAGHALCHSGLFELVMKSSVCVLKAPVAVEQRMRVGVGFDRFVEGLEHQLIVVAVTDDVADDAAVTEVENGAEINLAYLYALIPLEFCHISKPLFVGLFCIELTVKKVLGDVLRILRLPRAAVTAVLDGGLDPFGAANAEDTFVVDVNVMVMPQLVIDASVALVRAVHVDLLNLLSKLRVLSGPGTQLAGRPLVVCRARNMQQAAGFLDGLTIFSIVFLYCSVDMFLSYLSKASLLTISSNFFSKWFSIFARYS